MVICCYRIRTYIDTHTYIQSLSSLDSELHIIRIKWIKLSYDNNFSLFLSSSSRFSIIIFLCLFVHPRQKSCHTINCAFSVPSIHHTTFHSSWFVNRDYQLQIIISTLSITFYPSLSLSLAPFQSISGSLLTVYNEWSISCGFTVARIQSNIIVICVYERTKAPLCEQPKSVMCKNVHSWFFDLMTRYMDFSFAFPVPHRKHL